MHGAADVTQFRVTARDDDNDDDDDDDDETRAKFRYNYMCCCTAFIDDFRSYRPNYMQLGYTVVLIIILHFGMDFKQ